MTTSILFSIADKEIVASDLANGRITWSGRPLDRDVVDLIQLDYVANAVVLLESYGSPPEDRSNLVSIDSNGIVLWRAKLPTESSTDCFTSVEVVDGVISAFTWSSHRVLIDPNTGSTVSDEFTK